MKVITHQSSILGNASLLISSFFTDKSSTKARIISFRMKKITFLLAIGNVKLKFKCFPQHLRMGTTIMK